MAANEELETLIRQNKRVWAETNNSFGDYTVDKAITIGTVPKLDIQRLGFSPKRLNERKIFVFDQPILEVAKLAAEKRLNPLVVNAGNNNDPIKIVEQGAIGVESDILRRSNLGAALATDTNYPIKDGTALYIKDVIVFKSHKYAVVRPCKVSVVISPVSSQPAIVSVRNERGEMVEDYHNESDKTKMQARINQLFEIALLKGHKCIVIDDFGCGVGNPIRSVIDMFNAAITRYPIKYVFFSITEPTPLGAGSKKRQSKKVEYKNYVLFNQHILRELF